MKLILSFILIIASFTSSAQIDIEKHNPTIVDGPPERVVEYKWPYFRDVPPFIGIIGSYEGWRSSYYTMGLALNFIHMDDSDAGGMIGTQFLHKRHFIEDVQSYEAEIGIYSYVNMGFNFNYHVKGEDRTFGVKPFIGISLYHCHLSWGYNFFSNKKNNIDQLRHSNWEFKVVIPVIAFKGKKERISYYGEFKYDYNRFTNRAYNRDGFRSNREIRSDIQLR